MFPITAGEALSLVGGDVTVTGEPGAASAGGAQLGILWAPGGRLALSALGGPGAAAVVTGELTDGSAWPAAPWPPAAATEAASSVSGRARCCSRAARGSSPTTRARRMPRAGS